MNRVLQRPADFMLQPWVMHYFPGVTAKSLNDGEWTLSRYVAMWDFIPKPE